MLVVMLLIFLVFPILSIPFLVISMVIDKRFSKIYLILFCISIGTIGLYYLPLPSADGARVLSRLDIYNAWNFTDMLNYHGFDKEPIAQLLFYFSSQAITPKILFAISGFLTYFLTLYPIIDYCNRNKVKYTTRLLAILVILSYHTIVSNLGAVRYPLGFSIIVFSWYIIYIKNLKVTGFLLSIIAVLVHNSFLPHLIILLVSHFTFKINKSRLNKILLWSFLLMWGLFSNELVSLIDRFAQNDILTSVGGKLDIYINRGYTNYWYIILGMSGGVVTLFSLYTLSKISKTKDNRNYLINESPKYFYLITNYFIFVLGSVIFANIFVRFLIVSVMLSVIPLIIQNQKQSYHTFIFNIIMIFAIITGFVYQFSMDLSVEEGWRNIIFKNLFYLWSNKFL